jgi:DNA invertase Pin-like site-specific DNA recombinase
MGRGGDTFLSPDLQRERIEAWAAYKGWTVAEWYVDVDVSGREGVTRPAFERMMQDAQAGRFGMVAVYRLTRFGRSVKDAATRLAELREYGCELASATEDFDTSSASGKLIQTIMFALAQFESERIGEEWSAVHRNRRARGLHHASTGVYGYRMDGAVPVEPDENAEHVESVYRLRLAGASYKALREHLLGAGAVPPRGRPGDRFGVTTLRWLLRNPVYAGLVRSGDELVPSTTPAIVPPETWHAVQAAHPHVDGGARAYAGLVSGLAVCAGCGYRMRHARKSSGAGFYRCTARYNARSCSAPASMSADKLDGYVAEMFLRRVQPARMPHGGVVRVGKGRSRPKASDALRRRVDELTAALDELARARFISGTVPEQEYARLAAAFTAERVEAERELAAAAAPAAPPRTVTWEGRWPELPIDAQRAILRTVVERVLVSPAARGKWTPASERARVEWR